MKTSFKMVTNWKKSEYKTPLKREYIKIKKPFLPQFSICFYFGLHDGKWYCFLNQSCEHKLGSAQQCCTHGMWHVWLCISGIKIGYIIIIKIMMIMKPRYKVTLSNKIKNNLFTYGSLQPTPQYSLVEFWIAVERVLQ